MRNRALAITCFGVCVLAALVISLFGGGSGRSPGTVPEQEAVVAVETPAAELDADRASEPTAPPAAREVVAPPPSETRPEPDAPTLDTQDAEEALVVVTAVDDETDEPISNVRIVLWPDPMEDEFSVSQVDAHEASLGQAPVTGEDGRAVIRVPAGVGGRIDARGEDDRVGTTVDEFPALSPGGRCERVLRVAVGYDLSLFGRIVGESGDPVFGAAVRFQKSGWTSNRGDTFTTVVETTTDPDGYFDALIPSWAGLVGRVDAADFGPALFMPDFGHDSRDTHVLIELKRGATLRGRVLGGSGPFEVCVSVEGYNLLQDQPRLTFTTFSRVGDPSWFVEVAPDGSWELRGLPAGADLTVELRRGTKTLRHERDLVLEPGEVRTLDWNLGAGATLTGTVLESGEPVRRQRIWLVPLDGYYRPGYFETYWDPIAKARTDREGRFSFEDVGPGEWLVGPAPERTPDAQSIAPLAQLVEIPPGTSSVEVEIEAHRGLYIRGHVVDPSGRPVDEAHVWVQNPDAMSAGADARDDGAFAIGPLAPGTYTISASSLSGHAESDEVAVEAGTSEVELRLNPGGVLAGVTIDTRSGEPLAADVAMTTDGWMGMRMGGSDADGEFRFRGMAAGTYSLRAEVGELVGIVHGIVLTAGGETGDIVVAMEPGATLRVRCGGEGGMRVVVRAGLAAVKTEWVYPGTPRDVVLPPGEVTVEFTRWTEEGLPPEGELTARLVAGEVTEVDWPGQQTGDD